MPLPSPVAQLPDLSALVQRNQGMSERLMQSAWASATKNNQKRDVAQAQQAMAAAPQNLAQGISWSPTQGTTPPLDASAMKDRDLLALTLDAEGASEGLEGMLAIGSVIHNRVGAGRWGNSLKDVIMAPGQFSAWNGVTGYAGGEGGLDMNSRNPGQDAYRAADMILSGQYRDPTGGALNYYNDAVANPDWGPGMQNRLRIGNHVFGTARAART